MLFPASWISLFIQACGLGITFGNTYSDPDRCNTKEGSVSYVFHSTEFCWLTRYDANLACPRNKKIVIVPVQFAIKSSFDECTKRVLNSEDSFCCNDKIDDTLYNGDCLNNIWNTEDSDHYHQFMTTTLQKCNNKKKCVLRGELFTNLQREIPRTRTFSSYLQINHQCITEPSDIVDICSLQSVSGKEIHIQNSLLSTGTVNETCTCHVNSQGNGRVTVRAIDVRTVNSGLILRSGNMIKDLSHSQQPLFGFKHVLTEEDFDITIVKKSPDNMADNLWLLLTGSSGQYVKIECKGTQHSTSTRPIEVTTPVLTTSPLPEREAPAVQEVVADQEDDFLEDYWPMIYLGAGSGITIILVVCVVGSILICRYSMMKEKRKGQYGNPYRHSQVNYNRSGQYDTVLDDMQHIPGHMVASNQETLEWR